MPNTENIDERVVEMRIDNRQFVSGAEKTIGILDKLKQALNFKNAGDGFNEVQRAADRMDLSGIASNVDKLTDRFSTLGLMGQRVIQNLTDSVYGFAKSTVMGLTIDPVTAGFGKYEEVLRKTQTIMSATMNEEVPERFGDQLEYVMNQEALMAWYTDETSASLNDMISTVSKLTNVGVKLEDAVWESEGIANWGWSAGATVQEQARAMYNLAQAMSVGSVKLMDWRSIENANMGTLEFKQTAIDTAVALGTLGQAADGTYWTLDELGKINKKTSKEVSAKNFNEALSEGWFSSGVLEKTLKLYGEYSRRLGAVMDDTGFTDAGMTAYDVMSSVDEIVEKLNSGELQSLEQGLSNWQSVLRKSFSEEDLPSINQLRYAFELLAGDEDALAERAAAMGDSYEKLSEEQFELAKRAFLMGQEYKTFGDVIDATKDAVSTGWMKTFQLIIGNAEEAKEVWTNVGDAFNEIFAEGAARRNAILKWWNSPGEGIESGRDAFLEAIRNVYEAVRSYIDPIIDGFNKVFSWGPAKEAGERLREITYRFRDFVAKLSLSESAQKGMTNFFKAIFSGAKKILQVLKPVTSFIGNMIVTVRDLFNLFFESFDNDAGKFDKDKFLAGLPGVFKSVSNNITKAWEGIKKFFSSFSDVPIVRSVFDFIVNSVNTIISGGKKLIDKIKEAKDGLEDVESPVGRIRDWFLKIWEYVKDIKIDSGALKDAFGKIGEVLQTVYTGLTGDEGDFKERIKLMLQAAIDAIKEKLGEIKISDLFEGARLGIMGYTALQFANFVKSFKDTAKKFESIPEAITGTFQTLSKTIESYGKAQSANTMVKMAAAIFLVALAILALSRIPEEKFAAIAVTLAFFFVVLSKIAKNISSVKSFTDNKNNLIVNVLPKFAASIIAIAILLAVAAAAFVKLKDLTKKDIFKGLLTFLGIMAIVLGSIWLLTKILKGQDVNVLWTLIGIAVVLQAVGSAFSKVKDLQIDQILITLLGLTMVVAAVALVIYTAKDMTASGGVGALLVILGIALLLNALIPPFLVFANVEWPQVWKAVVMFIAIAVAVAGIMFVVSKMGSGAGALKGSASLVLIGLAFVLFATSLAIAAPAIKAFTKVILGLMESLADTKDLGTKLALLALLGAALIPLAVALIAVSAAALVFGAALLIGGVGMGLFGAGLLAIASAVGILTVVLIPFGRVLIDFCNMIAENGKVLVGVVGTIILAILGAIVASKMNIAYSIVAVILAVISVIVQHGPQILEALGQILTQILVFFVKIIPMLVNFLAATIVLIIDSLANSLRSNKAALISAIENLFSVIIELAIEVFFRLLGDAFGGLWSFIATLLGEDDGSTGREISNWLAGIGEKLSGSVNKTFGGEERAAREAAGGVVGEFVAGLNDHDEELQDTSDLINGIATHTFDGADENAETAGKNLIPSFTSGAESGSEGAQDALTGLLGNVTDIDMASMGDALGGNFMTGIGNGAIAEGDWLNETMGTLAGNASSAWANNWQVKSPSKVGESIGRYWDLGIIRGLEGGEGDIASESDSLASRLTEAMQTAMANIALLSEEDFSISPVITPVVDMTNVEENAAKVSGMFSGSSTGVGRAGQINRSVGNVEALARNMQAIAQSRTEVSQDSYTINVYPSEGQSEEEIANNVIDFLIRKGVALG